MLVGQQQCQEPWELKVQARAKNFDFRLKAAIQHLPLARKLSRFSIRLKIYRVLIKFKGDKTQPPNRTKFTSFNSKFCKIFERFRIRHNTRTAIPATANNEESACKSPSILGNLAHFWHLISVNMLGGRIPVLLNRMILPYLAVVFKYLVSRNMKILSLVLIALICICLILLIFLLTFYPMIRGKHF